MANTVPTYVCSDELRKDAYISSMEQYKEMYQESLTPQFWDKAAKSMLDWMAPYDTVSSGGFEHGDVSWFNNGRLNACYNCVDRHVLNGKGDKVALLFEGDQPSDVRKITYSELLREVCRFANVLKRSGIRRGDNVCIYMPMVPEVVIAMLACARIGAPHTVVFAGFSIEALRDRIVDGNCRLVITADQGLRGNKAIPLKRSVDSALTSTIEHNMNFVNRVIVYKNTGCPNVAAHMIPGRDIYWHDAVAGERPVCSVTPMDSEDPLFLLFTSGSTGRPKGIQHSTAGYLLYAMMTTKYVFDVKDDDVYACVADVGWITGHSYVVYGPLLNGATSFLFESTPLFPDAGRYWDMVQRHKISIFYSSPTAIRALMKYGDGYVTKYDRSSLRILGSVGEPINPEAWRWFYEVVGDKKATIVDTYWQTETGGHVITALPGAIPTKPGSATLPFFGIEPVILDTDGKEMIGNDVSGLLCIKNSWPGMARTCWGDHNRFMQTYLTAFKGYYFTGDGCYRDADGYYWITGRVDDVINVSGHRIGSAEIESALVGHKAVAESAVVGVPHDIKGQALFAFVTLKNGYVVTDLLKSELILAVAQEVGSFAKPDYIVIAPSLPKTRSGKIMRRLLRKIACCEAAPIAAEAKTVALQATIVVDSDDKAKALQAQTSALGDLSTLADVEVIEELIIIVNAMYDSKKR